jgi:hypothetical protein
MVVNACWIARSSASRVRALAARTEVLIFDQARSIGARSGYRPLARALEAEVARQAHYIVRVVPTAPLPVEQANRLGQHLAESVEHFLTIYFAIPPERLSLEVSLPSSTAEGSAAATPEPQRWRLEVFQRP